MNSAKASSAAAPQAQVTRTGILSAALLSIVSYFDESTPADQKQAMQQALGKLTSPVNGPWQITWGPAINSGVLGFVAQGADGTFALALRGTLTEWSASGMFMNVFDDLDAVALTPFLYPQSTASDGPAIAYGSALALMALISATDPTSDLSLIDYLRAAAAGTGQMTLAVVGHSLGGDLANLAAAWLHDQLPKAGSASYAIVPYTFAAPTTGNKAFATLWNNAFGAASYAAVNTQDIVPMAWSKLSSVEETYGAQGGTGQQVLKDYSSTLYYFAIPAMEAAVDGLQYTPVTPSQADVFTGPSIASSVNKTWATCAAEQHGLQTCYVPHVWFGWYGDLAATPPSA